jgi:hypothetical protein
VSRPSVQQRIVRKKPRKRFAGTSLPLTFDRVALASFSLPLNRTEPAWSCAN